MLRMMRQYSQSWLIYLAFGIIIVVFVFFFGPQSDGCSPSQATSVATVDGYDVPSLQLEELHARVYQRENRGGATSPRHPVERRFILTQDLVLIQLLAREAREAGLEVSDQQLSEYVRSPRNPDRGYYYDARSDEFDLESYELGVPSQFGLALDEYEDFKASELLAVDYMNLLQESVVVSPAEVEAAHRLRNTTYELEYIELDPDELEGVFAVPDEVVAEALANDEARFVAYYEEHAADYEVERQMRFSRIKFTLDPGADPATHEEVRATYEDVLQAVTDDPDSFADAARTHSTAPEAVEGGDLGVKPASRYEQYYPGLEEHMATIAVGDIVTHETETSLFIYRLDEDVPAHLPPFEELGQEIARTVLQAERPDPLPGLASTLLETARTGLTLEESIAEYVQQSEGQTPEEESEAAEDAEDGDEDEAEEDGGGPGLADLLRVERTEPFALDRPGVDLGQFDPRLLGQAGPPDDPNEIPGVGPLPELARSLEQLAAGDPVASEVYSLDDKLYVFRLAALNPAPSTIDDASYAEIRAELHRQKVSYLFGPWQLRLLGHEDVPLGPFLDQLLDSATESGLASFNDGYFQYEPEPAEEAAPSAQR